MNRVRIATSVLRWLAVFLACVIAQKLCAMHPDIAFNIAWGAGVLAGCFVFVGRD